MNISVTVLFLILVIICFALAFIFKAKLPDIIFVKLGNGDKPRILNDPFKEKIKRLPLAY
jgi:hypothetical protein